MQALEPETGAAIELLPKVSEYLRADYDSNFCLWAGFSNAGGNLRFCLVPVWSRQKPSRKNANMPLFSPLLPPLF